MAMIPAPCITPIGPPDAKIALLGEAPGKTEELLGLPFVGESGKELSRMLAEAKINEGLCYKTNVFKTRPENNKLITLCLDAKPKEHDYPALLTGSYLAPEFYPEVYATLDELRSVRPNVIVALGNTACWALFKEQKMRALRGKVRLWEGIKVIPTYHPAAVLRDWSLRVVVVADLIKAAAHSQTEEYIRPQRQLLIDPTLYEVIEACKQIVKDKLTVTCDIETFRRQITCIGFAPSPWSAITIPFVDHRKSHRNYWESFYDEIKAWVAVREVLEAPDVRKIFQNGLYDVQYLARMGFKLMNWSDDTMILHHALYPELPKSLEFLGSVYTDETEWKSMRRRTDVQKRDE